MTSTLSRERVLIVEDDPTTRLGLTELVGTWGYTTESAADGEDARGETVRLEQIADRRPTLGIAQRRHEAARLVEHDVHGLVADDALAVDLDLVDARIRLAAELGDDLAVHAHAPIEDDLLGAAA